MTAYTLNLSGFPTGSLRSTCPVCDHIHTAADARAVGRFRPEGVEGYRARTGGELRATRAEAVADECRRRVDR